jgi:hypothetical protein
VLRIPRFSLPLFEACCSIVLTCIVTSEVLCHCINNALVLFLLDHGTQRLFSVYAQGKALTMLRALVRPDSGLLLLVRTTLAVFEMTAK